jgi:hypothetical protein
MEFRGVSRGTNISVLRSFSITSAARSIREYVYPFATAERVFMEHGIITIACATPDPLAKGAEKSPESQIRMEWNSEK